MSRLGRNILYNIGGQGVVLLVGFVAVRFIYRHLGREAVGLIFFALTLNSVLTAVMDFGISSTIVREVARSGIDRSYVHRLVRTAGLFYWSSYAALATILVFRAGWITEHWLKLDDLDGATARTSLAILGAGALLALPKSLYAGLFRGLQRMDITNIIDVIAMTIQQAGIAVTIGVSGGIVAVSWWITLSTVAHLAAYAVATLRIVDVAALIPGLDTDVLRLNRAYTVRVTILSALAVLHTHADKLIVSRFLPLGLFGVYAFGFNALSRGMLLTGAVAQAAFPSMAALHRAGDREGLLRQYRDLQALLSFAAAAIFAAAPFAALPVFRLLFGPTEADNMLLPCTLLALGFYMNSTLNVPHVLSLAMGKPEISLSLNGWAILTVLPITIFSVWRWGLVGAAFSWVVYHTFAYLYAVPRMCRECVGEPSLRWYVGVARFIGPAAMLYGLGWYAAYSRTGGSVVAFGGAYAFATVAYAMLGWTFLSADTRHRLRCVLRDGLQEVGFGYGV